MGRALAPAAGFSLVELLIALAVAAVLIGIGIPAFNGFVDQQRLTTRTNDFVGALAYARSEAVKLGGVVSVIASAPDSDNEWGSGYCIAVGAPANCAGAVLRNFDGADTVTLDGVGALNDVNTISFNARGTLVGGAGGVVRVCSTTNGVTDGRTVSVTVIGRTNAEEFVCP